MQFNIVREALLQPLQQVISVVERRNTMPVLSNLLLDVSADTLAVTGSDLEVELRASVALMAAEPGAITVPARKLFDIVKALPEGVDIQFRLMADRMQVKAGRSRFTLTSLPAADFPAVEGGEVQFRLTVQQGVLKSLLEQTMFAMAVQDVRYYLNGLLIEARPGGLRAVATDGHRMALVDSVDGLSGPAERQVIIPRKGVAELYRLLDSSDTPVELELRRTHVRAVLGNTVFSSKIIDGRYPDYEAVVPIGADQLVKVSREALRAALQRAAILANEKYRGVKLDVTPGMLRVTAHNPEQEEATEEVSAETDITQISVGFNVNYVLDAIAAVDSEEVVLCLRDGNSSGLFKRAGSDRARHVVMPLRL
jgi:DNA polymerase-3 subunit beta